MARTSHDLATQHDLAMALFIATNKAEIIQRAEAGMHPNPMDYVGGTVMKMFADSAYAKERKEAEELAGAVWAVRGIGR